MDEYSLIFDYDLPAAVFCYASFGFMALYACFAIWSTSKKHETPSQSVLQPA
jgi:hypothetical protein